MYIAKDINRMENNNMRKRFWSIMLLLCVALTLLPTSVLAANIASGTCGANLTWTISSDNVLTISGSGEMADYTQAQSTYNRNNAPWRNQCKSIREVVIQSGVTSIGNFAFFDCTGIERVTLPNTLRRISRDAFASCSALTTISIPQSVVEIQEEAFVSTGLKQVTLPNGINAVSDSAFAMCKSLEHVTLPASITSIGFQAFAVCDCLEDINIPDHVTTIGNKAFLSCDNLHRIVLPKGLKTIGFQTFYGTGLYSIEIPNSVTTIGEHAFNSCTILSNITLPAGITEIGSKAFGNCPGLSDVYYAGSPAQWKAIKVKEYNEDLLNSDIHYYSSAPSQIQNLPTWSTSNQWWFENTNLWIHAFAKKSDGYTITSSDFQRLMQNLSITDRTKIMRIDNSNNLLHVESANRNFIKWNGSCYGMSATAVLLFRNVLSTTDFGESPNTIVNDVRVDNRVRSFVNFYHAQQKLTAAENATRDFEGKTLYQQLISMESQIRNGGPIVIGFGGNKPGTKKVMFHAIVAHGIEEGNFQKKVDGETYQFQKRFLVYDCAYPNDENYYIYYTTSPATGGTRWAIPGYGLMATKNPSEVHKDGMLYTDSENNAFLQLATNDAALLNAVDFRDGSISRRVTEATVDSARLYYYSDQNLTLGTSGGQLNVEGARYERVGGNGPTVLVSGTANITGDDEDPDYLLTMFLPEQTSYTVDSLEPLAYGFGDHGQVAYMDSESPGRITFGNDGSVNVKTTQNKEATIVLADDKTATSWDTMQIATNGYQGVTVSPASTGVVLTGGALSGTKITATSGTTTTEYVIQTTETALDVRYQNGAITVQKHMPNPFKDVSADQYYYDPVLWAVNHDPQITKGTSDTTFSPDATCTRGQVVTFLWRANGCPEPTSTTNKFRDVQTSDYFYKAVLWAVEKGITLGTSDTTFSPNDPCTRAHVVTFLWRSEGQPKAGSTNPFNDVSAGQYYTSAVLWAVSKNITQGTSANTFSPDSSCTRAQIVTFLYRDMK